MMKKFVVTVNGTTYDVNVEEVPANAMPAPAAYPAPAPAPTVTPVAAAPAAPAPVPVAVAPAPVAAPTPAPAPAAPAAAGKQDVTSPMPGNIWEVKVAVGDQVAKHQVLVILEAMKMENEIVAPEAGTVTAIHVQKGDSVEAGNPIITLG